MANDANSRVNALSVCRALVPLAAICVLRLGPVKARLFWKVLCMSIALVIFQQVQKRGCYLRSWVCSLHMRASMADPWESLG